MPKQHKFPLEDRTKRFAIDVRDWIKLIPNNAWNHEYQKQLIRSSGSVAANYLEGSEAGTKKEFKYRLRLSRKEAKESQLWIELIDVESNLAIRNKADRLHQEALELVYILTAILGRT